MRETRPLEEYADLIFDHRNDPHTLADLSVEMAAKIAYLTEGYKPIKLAKAAYWLKKYTGDKPLSEVYLETQWEASEIGQKELKMKLEIEGLDRLIAACKSVAIEAAREARNI
jgi:hypothetical protein